MDSGKKRWLLSGAFACYLFGFGVNMKTCNKHREFQIKYHNGDQYEYQGDNCDWCERLEAIKQDNITLDSGNRIRVVVTRSNHDYRDVDSAMMDVERTYPFFTWKHAGQFMDTFAFSTMMNLSEMNEAGISR